MNILHHYGTVHAQDARKLRRWGLQMRGIMAQASALGQISSSKEMLAFGKNRYITTSVKACAIDLIRDSEEDPQLRINLRPPESKRTKLSEVLAKRKVKR